MEGLRPLNVGELLDSAIRIYRSRWKTLLAAVAVPVIPVVVLSALVSWSAQPGFSLDPSTGQINADGGDLALTLVATFVSILAIFVATSVATAACFRSLSGAYVGDDATWRESLRFGFSRLGSVVGLTILNAFALVVGFFACVVGIFWVLAFFSVAMPVLLVEGQGVFDSFGRSRALVRGSGWRVLGIVLLSAILASIFQAVLSAPLGFLVFTDAGPLTTQLISVPTQVLATILVTPFTAALTMALYVDLRVRKEGFDLALWAQRLGTPGPSATAGVTYPSDGGYSFPPVPQAPSPGNAPFPLAVPPPPPPPTPPPPSPPPPPPPSQGSPGGAWTPPPTTDWSPPPGDG